MMGRGMSAVQEAIGQRERALRRLFGWPWCWPLLTMPTSLIVYVLAVLGCDLALIGWELAGTPPRAGDLLLFGALLAAAVICIEAMRRLGQPSGVSRDLLSAWWLPIALLLPPLYALLAPFAVGAVLYVRGRRIPVYRRVFSSAALGLAGAATSATFHLAIPNAVFATLSASRAWLSRPSVVLTAVACAVVFAVVNSFTVAVAAHLADPDEPIKKMLWDRETLLLDLTETCVGIRVTVSIGVAVLGQHGHDMFELLAAADVALYRAKDAGRDQVRVYAHASGNATAAEEGDEATDACP
jgi:Diguanylate cyclase, GGDEF domain